MKPVAEMPDYAVAKLQPESCKNRVKKRIYRYDPAVLDIIAHLPAYGPLRMQNPNAFVDHISLQVKVVVKRRLGFIVLSQIVRRGRYDKFAAAIRNASHEFQVVDTGNHRLAAVKEPATGILPS